MDTKFSKWWSENRYIIVVMDKYETKMLARHRLISSCFSWNHGRRGCLGPGEEKSRVKMKRSSEIQMKRSDGMQDEWLDHPWAACYQISGSMQRKWKRQTRKEKKETKHLVRLRLFFFVVMWLGAHWRRHDDTYTQSWTFPSHHSPVTDLKSILQRRKVCAGTKEKQLATSRINTISQ